MFGAGGVPCGLFLYFRFEGDWWKGGSILGGLVTGIVLDKLYEGRFRKLQAYEANDAA
jgi:hypothetical protein